MSPRRSGYLDIPSARRGSYSSYGHRGGSGILRKIGFTLVALIVIVVGAGIYQWTRSLPAQQVRSSYASSVTAPGTAANLPWPTEGQAAVAVTGGATLASPAATAVQPAPIASLAKMMTAYQILTDHPLGVHSTGPTLHVTAADVADYQKRVAQHQSLLKVVAGEQISEYTALEALLIPSANNIAVLLARWDAGSVSKFVAKINATAHQLGLAQTHYADPDGISPSTTSTAVDQLVLAQKVMAIPTFAKIVRQPSATFPIAGNLFNYNFEIGHHGFIGIKTGSDDAAGGCWAFAAKRSVDGKPSVVYGVVLGQRSKQTGQLIQPALDVGRRLADAAPTVVRRITLVPTGTSVGTLHAAWRHDVPLVTKDGVSVVSSPGQTYAVQVSLHVPTGTHVAAGTVVGTLTVAGVSTPVVVGRDAIGPTMKWRLTRL